MHFEDVKASLRKENSSLSEVARELGVSRQAVSLVIRGAARSRRIERLIAQKIGKPVGEVFPERYPAAVCSGVA